MDLEDLWGSLEKDVAAAPGGFAMTRRLYPASGRDIRVAVDRSTSGRMLLLRVVNSALDTKLDFPRARGFELRVVTMADDDPRHVTLCVVLTRPDHSDVFTSLVGDVASHLATSPSDRDALERLVLRLERWQGFLERNSPEGLTPEAQRGLFGELWFLRNHALPAAGARAAVESWVGPHAANQDFQFPEVTVEVKASSAKQHQVLHIASERQLDETGAGKLILLHVSLDEREGRGETLPDLVGELRGILLADAVARDGFEERLMATGYIDAHVTRYRHVGYSVRETHYYHVHGDFPRIIEKDIRHGVGDVRYSIEASACVPFQVGNDDVLALLGGR